MTNYDERGRRKAGRNNYVPSTRVGKDEPRRTSLGAQSRGGGREGRPVRNQRGQSRYRSERNYRTLAGHDTGYSIKGRGQRINFDNRHRDLLGRYGISNRMLVVLAAGIVLLLILILAISSCVRGCSSSDQVSDSGEQSASNAWDSRVAAGASQYLTSEFTTQLDQRDKLATIAANADQYGDERIPELATLEPAAIDFVAAYPTAEKVASSYTDGNEQGSYPQLFDWDVRWGYVSYAGSVIGVNGSGPTTMAMAYMGLTGKTDKTPADFATDATNQGYTTDEDISTTADFFTYEANQLGLTLKEYTVSGENLSTVLGERGQVVVVKLKANFDTPYAHWALVVSSASDGSVSLYDPASATASAHGWAAGTIAAHADAFYALSYSGTTTTTSSTEG